MYVIKAELCLLGNGETEIVLEGALILGQDDTRHSGEMIVRFDAVTAAPS